MWQIFEIVTSLLFVIMYVAFIGITIGYYFVLPYFIAKKFNITNNFVVDCVISYLSTWFCLILGNLVYILISLIVNKKI